MACGLWRDVFIRLVTPCLRLYENVGDMRSLTIEQQVRKLSMVTTHSVREGVDVTVVSVASSVPGVRFNLFSLHEVMLASTRRALDHAQGAHLLDGRSSFARAGL